MQNAMQESLHAFNRAKKHPTNENLTEFKRKRANFRRIIKENKKQSWRNYISSMNPQTLTSVVWKKIKCINGSKFPTNIQFLAEKFQEYSNYINSPHPAIINNYIHHDLIHSDNNSLLNLPNSKK